MRFRERFVEVHAPGQIARMGTLESRVVDVPERLEAGPIRVAQRLGGKDRLFETHGRPYSEEPATTPATTSATRPLNSANPPQPDSAMSSAPGSKFEMSRVWADAGSK